MTGERESADLFRAAGFEVVRLQNNVLDAGDYTATLHAYGFVDESTQHVRLLVDAKRRERLNVPVAWAQVASVARELQVPCLSHRRNREPWLVTLSQEDFLRIVAR